MVGCNGEAILMTSPKFKWEIRVGGKLAAEATDENKDAFLLRYQTLFKRKKVEAVRLKKPKKVPEVSEEMAKTEEVSDVN